MFQSHYFIAKKSGFYQDVLTLYGLSRLLDMIINTNRKEKIEIILKDFNSYYRIELEDYELTEDDLISFCQNPKIGFDYIFQQTNPKKGGTKMPIHPDTKNKLSFNYIDIQKEWEILKNKSTKNSENSQSVNPDFSIYALLSHFSIEFSANEHNAFSKQGGMFTRTFLQLFLNKDKTEQFIRAILYHFSSGILTVDDKFRSIAYPSKNEKGENISYITLSKSHSIDKTTYNQLISPTSSKGINSSKPKLTELPGEPDLLIEYLKILGCFEGMYSIGGSTDFDDYRVYVCEPKEIYLSMQRTILKAFRKGFFSNSSIKGDILSELLYSKEIIKHTEELNTKIHFSFEDIFSPKNYVNGFYVCHYMTIKKSPPKKHAPINLAFLKIPTFIDAKDINEANMWLNILDELISITRSIKGAPKNEESGNALVGLTKLRTFLGASDIEYFLDFQMWYSLYLMSAFNKKQQDPSWLVIQFKTSTLDKILNNKIMDEIKITEITSNEGFLKIAYAIRKSTVSLIVRKDSPFEIRYGVAQQLQIKSKSSTDLAIFIADFIGIYNDETAKEIAKIKDENDESKKKLRQMISNKELDLFYKLLDTYPSRLIGSLLSSYGFAKEDHE